MFMQLIRNRRSVRKFQDKPIEPEKVEALVEAALRSPSSRSLNPWEFIVINDKELLTKLSNSKPHGASFLKGAPLGIVVLADPEKCDVWVEDTSIASTYIQLAAEAQGLKSCWIQIRKRPCTDKQTACERVSELLSIPPHLKVESIIAIGYPDEKKEGHKTETLQYEKVHFTSYGLK